jgi:hypothetical protein
VAVPAAVRGQVNVEPLLGGLPSVSGHRDGGQRVELFQQRGIVAGHQRGELRSPLARVHRRRYAHSSHQSRLLILDVQDARPDRDVIEILGQEPSAADATIIRKEASRTTMRPHAAILTGGAVLLRVVNRPFSLSGLFLAMRDFSHFTVLTKK